MKCKSILLVEDNLQSVIPGGAVSDPESTVAVCRSLYLE